MTCVIRVLDPPEVEGQYLMSFNFEAFGGQGLGVFTNKLADAKRFNNAADACEFWRTAPKIKPVRPDGKPNRPLTASTIEIVQIPEGE